SLNIVRGRLRWFRTSLQPIHDKQGRVSQVLLNATDIHEIKKMQQQLLELNLDLEKRVAERTAEVQDLYDNAPAGYHS
ncbi:MAG: PAS domain S-box protein, partial [Caldilinea sp.]|nr:PAS domain S-box protein [Caldilinea sp.]